MKRMDRRGFLVTTGALGALASATTRANGKILTGMLGTQHSHFRGKLAALQADEPLPEAGRELESTSSLQPAQPLDPLSDRELEVLRLLTTQLKQAEIAEELFISVNTLRTHIKSIHSKLYVHHRMAAVRRAQELGLLN